MKDYLKAFTVDDLANLFPEVDKHDIHCFLKDVRKASLKLEMPEYREICAAHFPESSNNEIPLAISLVIAKHKETIYKHEKIIEMCKNIADDIICPEDSEQ